MNDVFPYLVKFHLFAKGLSNIPAAWSANFGHYDLI